MKRSRAAPDAHAAIMGIGERRGNRAREVKATELMKATEGAGPRRGSRAAGSHESKRMSVTGNVSSRARVVTDPIVWTQEAWAAAPTRAAHRPPAGAKTRVERFARNHDIWRVTTPVMDDNKQAMIEATEFDVDTMMVMFTELRAKQIARRRKGRTRSRSPEMRAFIEEAKSQGITRCPIRDIERRWRVPGGHEDGDARRGETGGRETAAVNYVPHVVAWNLTRRCNLECATATSPPVRGRARPLSSRPQKPCESWISCSP